MFVITNPQFFVLLPPLGEGRDGGLINLRK